jgi:polyisoprenyl-phosphate glycosyltransferase
VKYLTILTPCFNEEDNVREVHARVKDAMQTLGGYDYEHLFIDNASTDGTVDRLRELARDDGHVKIILNTRNFGAVRSSYHGLLQAHGDAVIGLAADLQDPPELIPQLVEKWEEGYKVVLLVKRGASESRHMLLLRRFYYWLSGRLSDVDLAPNATGAGLFDREVVEACRTTDEQYPYLRGLICDLGYDRAEIGFVQPVRKRGISKHSLYSLYDLAMLGITNHSKIPLRIATMTGFAISMLSALVALGYLVAKLLFWNDIQLGIAPLLIGIYFFGAVQLFFVGVLGEYIGSIHTQVHKRPMVVEKERINFDADPGSAASAEVGAVSGRLQPRD